MEELVGESVFRLIMGGYMAGNSTVMDVEQHEYFLGHWRAVHERTEQPFDFAFDMGPEFVYDTGPACRAVVAMQMLDGGDGLPGLSAVQEAFYQDNRDVTDHQVLGDIAEERGLDRTLFLQALGSDVVEQAAGGQFATCRKLGITAFPTLLVRRGPKLAMVTQGYQPFEDIKTIVEGWLARDE